MPNCRVGSYTLGGIELCLLGMKGKLKRKTLNIRQVLMSPRTKHSQKPEKIRNDIVSLYGDLPRIELFARQKTEGWDVWGDEVEVAP
jgi:site-specific DNA-methyltransferase (adenine-specific)